MRKNSFFITVEGIEGVGKSTCVDFIKKHLEEAGKHVLLTREPGGTLIAEQIRKIVLHHSKIVLNHSEQVLEHSVAEELEAEAELLLFFAARIQHCNYIITPALQKGCWVVCDRFIDASYAYQGGGRGISQDKIKFLESFIENKPEPDLTLLLNAPYDIVENRYQERTILDRIEQEEKEFFLKAQNVYLDLAKKHSDRYRIIDASQSIEEVISDIKQILNIFLT